jgi:hypothetical protein
MFLLYHSEGCNICEMVLHECYVNDLHTTTCSGMMGHHSRPPAGWVKLSVDGFFKGDDGSTGAGMALLDDLGNPMFTSCCFLLTVSPLLKPN